MARNSQADPRRMYSWWWDSHISPKNSKWLQENLTDMDAKVKQMIKVINEDADSFARRAEMYYKKRPELMKLVEEFYRAYRALAERYDHATGVIRQAHHQIAEAFPNQMPFGMPDDLPVGSANEGNPRTPDLTPVRAIFDSDMLQKDASGNSPANSHGLKRNGGFGDESDSVPGRKGLKQLNDLFGSGIAEAKARKGLNFHDSEEKDVKAGGPSDSERVGKAEQEIESLKSAIAKLEAEKDAGLLEYQRSMERLSRLESEVSNAKDDSMVLNVRASNAEAQVETLKGSLAKLQAERETSLLQYQQGLEKMSNLESSILLAKKDTDEISERASKAEDEAQSLQRELGRVKAEKEEALVQYNQCLKKISDLERKLLLVEEDAKSHKQRADEAETEVETLKEEIDKLTEKIDTASVQYQQCVERISVLEGELASAQEEVKRLNVEIDNGVTRLKGAEERCLLLENSNQTMHSELETLSEKMDAQSEELTEKQKELGRLWTCIQEERLRFVEAETAFQTLQHLHSQSQEELRSMAAELQKRAHILEDLEARNQNLQNETEQVKLVNKDLNEVNLSSALNIHSLEDEISSLRETIQKLEAEVELRVDQRNALQQEIYCLQEELNELKKNHSAIVEQVESVGLYSTNFSTSVKDMQGENIKLKEASERDKTEKVALLEKLAIMEKLVEKKSLLENSLTDLNVELEAVRGKVKALEESCQHLLGEKSALVSEKTTLVSELQVATENLEKLAEKNNSLENFLLDANAELEQLRVKSKNLEDLCQLLETEKLDLVSAKEGLISQLDVSRSEVVDVENNYSNLEQKYFSLEKERQLALHESKDLRANLDILKQEHASLVQFSESHLANMASKICSLEKEIECKNKEYEEELDKAVNAEMEIFILRTSAKDIEEKNCSILLECQRLLEASKLSKILISELENENIEQHGEFKSLFHIEELRMKLYLVMKTLELVGQQRGDNAQQDKILLDNVLEKLQQTHELLCKMQDENQQLGIEKTVLFTLIEQLQLEVSNLAAAKISLNNKLMATSEKLLLSQSDSQKLSALTEKLRLKVMEGDLKEQVLKVELSKLQEELLHTVEAKQNLQEESFSMQDEQTHLMQSFSDLKEQESNLEEENCAIFAESLSQSILSLMLRDVIHGNNATIKDLNCSLDKLSHANSDLSEKVKMMDGKLERLGVIEIERLELQRELADMKCKYDEVEISRAEGEKRIAKLSDDYDQRQREIDCLQETNHKLGSDTCKVRDELLEATRRENSLKHELEEGRLEISQWESDISATLGKLQMSTVREALFEGKVHELIEACENLDNRNCSNTLEIQQLKERVGTLEGENGELKAQMHACIPAFVSLRDSVLSLENYTTQHDTHHGTESKEVQVVLQESGEQIDEESSMDSGVFLDLQELQIRINAIEKALMEKEHEYLAANSKVGGRGRNGGRVQKHSQEISEEGHEVMTKDIMLDQISECSSYGLSRRETDQMMEIWETANQDGSIDLTVGKTEKVNSAGIEKKHKKQNPSAELLVDKEVSVDKLEISKRFSGNTQETSGRKILERLDSDAQKLTNLQITVQDLMRKVEITEKTKKGKDIEYHSVREQLGESDDAIQKLFDFNRKLVKNIGDDPVYSDDKEASASDAKSRVKKRSIAEQARRGSEKIGRLQLEVQKLQFLLLKLDDQNKSSRGKTKIVDRKSSVLLRDYLYGGGLRSGSNQSRKKGHFCACVQPPTKGD